MDKESIVYNWQNGDTIEIPMLVASCLICGKDVTVSMWEGGPKICDECKQAIAWVKEKMKEKEDEWIST